jgi:hypothetical protein
LGHGIDGASHSSHFPKAYRRFCIESGATIFDRIIINNTRAFTFFFPSLFWISFCLYHCLASERLFSRELSNQHNRQLGHKAIFSTSSWLGPGGFF